MEILVFWKDMIVRIVFGILVLCSILSFLDVAPFLQVLRAATQM
jgi:hypothetical protein